MYANVNAGLQLDLRKQQDFVQSIQQQTVVALRRPHATVAAEGRPKPPVKPVRNSILLDRHHLVSVPPVPSASGLPSHIQPIVHAIPAPAVNTVAGVSRDPAQLATPQIDRKADEKENLPSTNKKSSFLFTPLRRTAFKKIGDRKLIRIKKKSLSPGTPKPSFKRIGNKKLIRIRDSLTTGNDVRSTTGTASPLQVYEIKTKTKLVKTVKNTPSNASKYRFSFITPLSVRKLRLTARGNSSTGSTERLRLSAAAEESSTKRPTTGIRFANRFRLDRRPKATAAVNNSSRLVMETGKERNVMLKRSSQSRLKKLGSSTYHVR